MPLFALLLRPWIIRMRCIGVIPRTLADDVRIQATQSGLHEETQHCTLMHRMYTACEQTFLFMDSMGAAVSVCKSHLYASNKAIRDTLRRKQWGSMLPADRGGQLEHQCVIYSANRDRIVQCICQATGYDILGSRAPPEGNAVCIRESLENSMNHGGNPHS